MISDRFKVQYNPSRGKSNLRSYIASRGLALAVMGIVRRTNSSVARGDAFCQAIAQIENPLVKKAPLAMPGATQNDLNKRRDNSEPEPNDFDPSNCKPELIASKGDNSCRHPNQGRPAQDCQSEQMQTPR